MKKVIKSIFIFILLSIMVNVNALNVGDQFTLSPGASQSHSASYGFNEQYQLHTVTGGGKTYDAYCMDRGKAAGQGASYVVNRMMPKLKGDYAVLYLMKNGSDKEQIHLAIRLLVSKGMLNWSHTGTADYLAKIDAAVNCMKSDSTFNSTLTEFLSNSSKKEKEKSDEDKKKDPDEGGKSIALVDYDVKQLANSNINYYTCNKCTSYTVKGILNTTPEYTANSMQLLTKFIGKRFVPKCGTEVNKKADFCYTIRPVKALGITISNAYDVWLTENQCAGEQYYSKNVVLEDQCTQKKAESCNALPTNICSEYNECTFNGNKCQQNCIMVSSLDCLNYSNCAIVGNSCKDKSAITINNNTSDNDQNCDTGLKRQKSLDTCKAEKEKKEQQSFNTKKYTCEPDNSTKCFKLVEDNSSNGNNNGNNNGNTGGNAGTGGTSGGGTSVSCGGFDGIKQLLIDAMNYANEKFNSETGESKVEKGPATEPEKADGIIKKIVSVKIDIKNITDTSSDSEYFKYLGFEVEKQNEATEVKLLGASKEFINTEEGWEPISEGVDLSKLLDERNGTIYVGFLVSRPSSDDSQEVTDDYTEEEDCEVKIKFKYEYSNEDGGAVLYAAGNTTGQQRFFIASEGEPIQDEFELDTSLCDETTCDPTSTLPNICEDGLEPDKETGNVEYEFREAYNSESGKYNIKKCLLSKNSKDKAGNEYKLKDDEYASMVSDNDYCEVKCKEDYIFGVPYKRTTESGRYFQISVSLKGEQDCYTTKLDYKKYTEDVAKKQAEIIDAYNDWLENFENYTFSLVEGDAVSCSAISCKPDTDTNGNNTGDCTAESDNDYKHKKMIDHSDDFYTYEIKEETDKWIITNVKTGATRENPQFGDWTNTRKCNGCSLEGDCEWKKTPDEHYAEEKEGYKTAIESAKQTLKQKMEELRQIVDKYNSCAADHDYASKQTDKSEAYGETAFWDMIYRYNPDIQYSYEEPEPGISSTRWISTVQGESCEHGMNCDFMYSPDALVEAEKCADTSGGKVTCSENTSIMDVDDDSHVSTWYCDGDIDNEYEQCNGSTNLEYSDEYHWMVPDADLDTDANYKIQIGTNMTNSKHIITKVDYVHKIASSKGTYKTERVYYSGHDDGDIKIEGTPEHEIENYDIVDGLPVGINTPTGTYYYKLTLNNFGTFYSNINENGRIYSDLTNSLSSLIRENTTTKNSDEVNSNEYACTYEVNQNSCTDASGNKHYKTECDPNEDWDKCQERLCPVNQGGPYCVEKSQSYYVCSTTHYDESCQPKGSREEALLAVGCQPGEECENNYNCCPNCVVQCIGVCTVTPDGSQGGGSKPNYDFRPISPGNLFPNDRPKGYNWESDPSVYNNSLVARKAKDTIDEITTRANNITSDETTPSSGNPKVEDYSLKVVMDTDMITKIREYNKTQESYNNDTMTCYDYQIDRDEDGCKKAGYTWKKEGDSGKCVMANIFCYSSFVDDLADGKFGGEVDIKNKEGRTKAKEQFSKPYVAPGVSNTDNLIVTNDYWTIYTFNTLDINGDGIPDVGPSWK